MNQEDSRRKFIKDSFYLSTVFLSIGMILSACTGRNGAHNKKKNAVSADPCDDFSEVSEEDMKKREKLGYVKQSPIPDRHCGNCNLHIPPAAGKTCGRCLLFKGPVYSTGYCTYWAPLTQS